MLYTASHVIYSQPCYIQPAMLYTAMLYKATIREGLCYIIIRLDDKLKYFYIITKACVILYQVLYHIIRS